MKKLMMLFFWGAVLLLSAAPLAAQNTVDVLGGAIQVAPRTNRCQYNSKAAELT